MVPARARGRARTIAARPVLADDGAMATSGITKRSGWVTFAGVVALVVGGYNALGGIAAISDDDVISEQAQQVLFGLDLTVWGWFWLIVGLIQVLTGVLILQRNEWGRWLGIAFAGISALATVFVIFIFPLWAIAVLGLNALVLHALITHEADFD
jgi:hypothetical protein